MTTEPALDREPDPEDSRDYDPQAFQLSPLLPETIEESERSGPPSDWDPASGDPTTTIDDHGLMVPITEEAP